jgi:hypothetical protein
MNSGAHKAMKLTNLICAVLVLAVLAGCGGGSMVDSADDLLGLAAESHNATSANDMDYDGVPDDIENQLGTDPENIDSDMDGLTDHYELWGERGLPVGIVGSLSNLPDADHDGIISALDRNEAGKVVLKSTSALDEDRIPVPYPDVDPQPENDLDDDWIPSDFELHGFYYELDAESGQDYFVKWDGDISKPYYKTDPTKWSSDGDPWSDWEEATKLNLDQRVKIPGDHPCIPAYPDLYVTLDSYSIELNEDVDISSSEGGSSERSWSQSLSRTETSTRELGGGAALSVFGQIGSLSGFGVRLDADFHAKWQKNSSGMLTENNSGLSSNEWSSATTSAQNTLEVARITMNLLVVNTGTLPATNPQILCNLKLGNAIITNFLVGYEGELKPQTGSPVEIAVTTDGFANGPFPLGQEMFLSMNQLRSIQSGAPVDIEVVDFEADTLVWTADPDTGRRLFMEVGDWSPYRSAIKNVCARIALDFSSHPSLRLPVYDGMPAKKVPDLLVFGYDNTGSYSGSPPRVRLADAFLWGFNARDNEDGTDVYVTFHDPVSKQDFTSSLFGWTFSFDQRLYAEILSQVTPVTNIFDLPLKPGNPYEYVYVASAPPPGELAKPRIYWANLELDERKVRAFSLDVRGIKEMRFKPDSGYVGELMQLGVDFNDPQSAFFYTYDIPPQYHWTGLERVIAVNNAGEVKELQIDILGDLLGTEVASGLLNLSYLPIGGVHEDIRGFNMEADDDDGAVVAPFDVNLRQYRETVNGPLLAELITANGGGIYDIGIAADLDQLDYNYLRKRPYEFGDGGNEAHIAVPLAAPVYPVGSPTWHNVFAVEGKQGSVTVFVPQLSWNAVTTDYYVSSVIWRRYEGI